MSSSQSQLANELRVLRERYELLQNDHSRTVLEKISVTEELKECREQVIRLREIGTMACQKHSKVYRQLESVTRELKEMKEEKKAEMEKKMNERAKANEEALEKLIVDEETVSEDSREDEITSKVIYQYLGRATVYDVAEKLKVSRKTLIKKCRTFGIQRWPRVRGGVCNIELSARLPESNMVERAIGQSSNEDEITQAKETEVYRASLARTCRKYGNRRCSCEGGNEVHSIQSRAGLTGNKLVKGVIKKCSSNVGEAAASSNCDV